MVVMHISNLEPFTSLQIFRDTITKYNVLCGDDNHDSYEADTLPIYIGLDIT